MANIKSAKKRVLTGAKRAEQNKAVKSRVKTYIKKVRTAIEAQDQAGSKEALKKAVSEISKARSKGVYHKNNASRKIARLSRKVDEIQRGG